METLLPEVFLFQAGHLSITRADAGIALLNFPNEEVARSMNRLMADRMLRTEV